METIKVRTRPNAYNVVVSWGGLRKLGSELRRLLPSKQSRVFVVTSPKVRGHWGDGLEQGLRKARIVHEVLEMNDGEPAKRLSSVERLSEQLVAANADRKSLVVAFGGGVVGDSAGFLAAIFMRGVPVVQVPTTVVAQVDASVGGKTGVNLRSGKNLIGAFHQPSLVLVDPQLLSTLSDREFRSGLFEALKCGVIQDRELFAIMSRPEKVLTRDRKTLETIIGRSLRVKARIVSTDERESGLRRILNFGHTVGHALEAATGYSQLLHGEAVAKGMIAAAHIASATKTCGPTTADQVRSAVLAYGPLPTIECSVDSVLARLAADKKTVAGIPHFVLPTRIGKVTIVKDVPANIVRDAVSKVVDHG